VKVTCIQKISSYTYVFHEAKREDMGMGMGKWECGNGNVGIGM
jgi:hypothetical protein